MQNWEYIEKDVQTGFPEKGKYVEMLFSNLEMSSSQNYIVITIATPDFEGGYWYEDVFRGREEEFVCTVNHCTKLYIDVAPVLMYYSVYQPKSDCCGYFVDKIINIKSPHQEFKGMSLKLYLRNLSIWAESRDLLPSLSEYREQVITQIESHTVEDKATLSFLQQSDKLLSTLKFID